MRVLIGIICLVMGVLSHSTFMVLFACAMFAWKAADR